MAAPCMDKGMYFLLLVFFPVIYRGVKDMWWTQSMRKLNIQEILNDRFEWLHRRVLEDQVAASVKDQAAAITPQLLGGTKIEASAESKLDFG